MSSEPMHSGSSAPGGDDSAVRREALDARASFIVRAPAGSGKTALLIQRLLRLLAEAAAPEEIVAITFTRKAAAEMRERLLTALRIGLVATAPEKDPTTWALARQALEGTARCGQTVLGHPNRLRIQTIDAFCHALARQNPWRSGVGGTLRTAEDAEPLYRDAARQVLQGLEAGGPEAEAVAHLLRHRDVRVDQVEGLLVEMLARRDQWLRHLPEGADLLATLRERLEATLAAIVAQALADLDRELRGAAVPLGGAGGLAARLGRLARHAARHGSTELAAMLTPAVQMAVLPAATAAAVPAWRAIRTLLLTKQGGWRRPGGINVTMGFPPGKGNSPEALLKKDLADLLGELAPNETLCTALAQLDRLPEPTYTEAQWQTLGYLVTALQQAVRCLRDRIAATGTSDFIEISQAAERVAAGSSADSFGIRHLLVDEFQDSSHGQFRLLQHLTAHWRPNDGRTLFLVGDPMQSIYRFREADVGLFLEAERHGIGPVALKPLRLLRNFRSVPQIVEANNDLFETVFPETADALRGAVTYAASSPARTDSIPHATAIHPIVLCPTSEDDGLVQEADRVAALAAAALQAAARNSRTPGGATVAILVQARTHLREILPALERAGVPVQAVALDPLNHRSPVLDALSLTRALLYPADRIAWLAVLRAPWCGLGLRDLETLAAHDGTLWEALGIEGVTRRLSATGGQRIDRLRELLAPALAECGRRPLRETVEGAWLALGGPACTAEADRGDVHAFFSMLEAIDADGDVPSPEELERRLARQRSVPPVSAVPAVQVMTIHESKGLEFDTVILPGLHRRTSGDTRKLLRWLELPATPSEGLVLAPIPEIGADVDAIHGFLDEVDRARAANERLRLLYVACTRARERLHLMGVVRQTEDGIKPPPSSTLLGVLWPAIESEFTAGGMASEGAPAPKQVAASAGVPSLRGLCLAADWTLPALPPPLQDQGEPKSNAVRERIVYDWAGPRARLVGKAVHALLQRVAQRGFAHWPPDAHSQRAQAERILMQEGLFGDGLDAAIDQVVTAVGTALADERGRWVLGPQRDARAEWELTVREGKRARRIILDRTFVDAEGVRWVVDYKTGSHSGGGRDAFLDAEQERYRAQLERYAQALVRLDHFTPVKCGLYFPLALSPAGSGGWREWPFSSLAAVAETTSQYA